MGVSAYMTDGAWCVVFPNHTAMSRLAWWQRLLPRGWLHVYAARADGEARTLVVNHQGRQLRVITVEMPIGAFVAAQMNEHQAAVLIALPELAPPDAVLRPPMTCVEAVKAALGLHSWWVLTPRQLHRHLARRGARRILPIPSKEPVTWVA